MKKIIILFFIVMSMFLNIDNSFADDLDIPSNPSSTSTKKDYVTVTVTEKIPWVECAQVSWDVDNKWNVIPIAYKCKVEKWATQIIKMLWGIIKYFTYIATLTWVLFIVYNGILYSMWWADQSLKDESKKRIIWTLLWIIVLLLSWPILQLIAPWIYK